MLGADIDPTCWVEAQHRLHPTGDPARDRDLLLVAAGEETDLFLCSGVDLQRVDGLVDLGLLIPFPDRPPPGDRRAEGQCDVLTYRTLHEQGFGSIGGHEDDPGAD